MVDVDLCATSEFWPGTVFDGMVALGVVNNAIGRVIWFGGLVA